MTPHDIQELKRRGLLPGWQVVPWEAAPRERESAKPTNTVVVAPTGFEPALPP